MKYLLAAIMLVIGVFMVDAGHKDLLEEKDTVAHSFLTVAFGVFFVGVAFGLLCL